MYLLIDADILLYKAASSVENEVEFEPDVWVMWTDVDEAVSAFDISVTNLIEQQAFAGTLLCFSDALNFRKNILPSYKGNRTSRKPMAFKAIRERVMNEWRDSGIVIKPNLEADDCLGILATQNTDFVIWSADKDLMQIPGKHLINGQIETVSQEDADLFFYRQVLTGDTVDNYKGCPGIGPVKADNMLAKGKPWETIVAAYEKAGLTEDDALVQARVARILRDSDWNQDTQEVILWTPSTALNP